MNQTPPAHYRKYWNLQDRNDQMFQDAKYLLLHYIQSWGYTNFEKTDSLTTVARRMGYKLETVSDPTSDTTFGWNYDPKKYPGFTLFLKEVNSIERGNFENEVVQLFEIINKYTIKPWYVRMLEY